MNRHRSSMLMKMMVLLLVFVVALPIYPNEGKAASNFLPVDKEITLQDPVSAVKTTEDWYRGQVLAIRIPWTSYIRDNPHASNAGSNFNAGQWVNMVKSSGADMMMLVVQHENSNGFLLYPSALTDANNRSPIDYPALLKTELLNQGMSMGVSINQVGITNLAAYGGKTRDNIYQNLVQEINTRYGNFLKEIYFDMFHIAGAAGGNYNHQGVFQKVRTGNSQAVMAYNHHKGTGAEDINVTESATGLHYWNQEDFDAFIPYRNEDWGHEFTVMLGSNWGTTDSIPLVNLLNMISRLGSMGITTSLTMGPDITGKFTTDQIDKLQQVGNWLTPRKPYMDGAIPDWNVTVTGYSGMNYVNNVGNKRSVHLLSGSANPVSLPSSITLNMSGVTAVKLAPSGNNVSFTTNSNGTTIQLSGIQQDTYDTILSVEGGKAVAPARIFQNDFNSMTTGEAPTTGFILDTTYGSITVEDVPTAVNKSMKIVDTNPTGYYGVKAKKTFSAKSNKVQYEVRMRADQTTAASFIELQNSVGDIAVRIGFAGNGQIRRWNNASAYTDLTGYKPVKWYTIKVEADIVAHTYNAYVNGVKKVSNAAFYTPVSTIDQIEWVNDFGAGTFYTNSIYVDGN
ncbi:alpha-L-fucosidase [Paenibacillus radicis (ex Xue et al. 2023)]|uniref:alpha-L-fucosidase n=1 Tax=Paenibacillus radicis (ex Xue et al. 2023) TaxID=2972489 RepID=A0ABT1YRN4_9BACL|nr:alpha-L-fucosidase [Paenibacillus radicis (ex Xue et al. 2023)]MCR8635830.1 alpha-L-fucosidase [Paenibacillus radicis (ex Xue et al. 2023)]